jgi:hypothetical protein
VTVEIIFYFCGGCNYQHPIEGGRERMERTQKKKLVEEMKEESRNELMKCQQFHWRETKL